MPQSSSITRPRGRVALHDLQPQPSAGVWTRTAHAPVSGAGSGEMPTTGGVRPGPAGSLPTPLTVIGAIPVAIVIQAAQVDAQVEQQTIDNGVMHDPSGPYIVCWYKTTGKLGEKDNVVMAGHLDWYGVPQAVFFHVGALKKGDEIDVTGKDKQVYKYSVDWVKPFTVAYLDQKTIDSIVGPTQTESLTLITCGGEWDTAKQEYLERIVVRASRAT
jgi:LPXTG-site transpeptidase (sortase) family protein